MKKYRAMKRILVLILLLFTVHIGFAFSPDKKQNKTLFEEITGVKKKNDKLNLYLNTHATFNAYFDDSDFEQASFKLNQLRIEAVGNINDWIFYRWRQLLNAANHPQSLDNTPYSIDFAGVGFRITPRFSIFAGKQCTVYGGFEFDLNPIEIYQYSDMIDYMTCFLTGINFAYQLTGDHELQFQVVNSRNGSMEDLFGKVPQGIEKSGLPLGCTFNWNGNFYEKMIRTRWSASVFNDARKRYMYYYALGNELNLDKFNMYFDFMYSDEDLDRQGIISRITYDADYEDRALDVKYMSLVAKFNYRIYPKWNVFVKGMYETASVFKANQVLEKGKYRTSYGYLGGIEYYPMKDNLHFFLTYVGRSYDFTARAKAFKAENYSTQRFSLGFIYQLPVF